MEKTTLSRIVIECNTNDYSPEYHFSDGTVILGGIFKVFEDLQEEVFYMKDLIAEGLSTDEIEERCTPR